MTIREKMRELKEENRDLKEINEELIALLKQKDIVTDFLMEVARGNLPNLKTLKNYEKEGRF